MSVACPHCSTLIGKSSREGSLRINGLAIMLVDPDGRIHGPCQRCKADVVIAEAAELSKSITRALTPPRAGSRRLVLVLDSDGS